MRPLHFLVIVLVLAVVVCVAWFVVGDASPAQPATGATPASSAAPFEATPDEPSALESAGSAETSEPARVAADVPRAPDAPPAARAPADGVVVVGEVRDEHGKPVPDALVLASGGGDPFFASLPLDVSRRREVPWLRRVETRTGADGRFEIAGIAPGPSQLAVRKGGFAPHDARGLDVPSGGRFDVGTIELQPSVIIAGRVVDARGRGVANASIERLQESTGGMVMFSGFRSSGAEVATTGADGSFTVDQLAAGAFKLRVVSDEHPDKIEAGSASRPGERINLTITLEQGYEIAGRVVGVPPEKQSNLRVFATVSRGESSHAEFDFEVPFADGEARDAVVNADGSFTVRGLREGKSYALRARGGATEREPFSPSLSTRVIARAGDRGVELAYQPEAALVFSVVDARTRQPLEKFEVQAGIDWRMPLPREEGEGERGVHPGGQVRFGGLRPRKPEDKASLEITAVGYRTLVMENLALAIGQDTQLGILALEPVPVTRVTVLDDSSGLPVSGARVTLRKAPEPVANNGFATIGRSMRVSATAAGDLSDEEDFDFGDEDRVSSRTDADGVAVLTSFEGTRCVVDVVSSAHAPYQSAEFTAALGAPEEHVARLKQGGSVRVTLQKADGTRVAGGQVEHESDGSDPMRFEPHSNRNVTDAQGEILFGHLAEGAHRFRPRDAGGNGVFGDGNFSIAIAGMDSGDDDSWSEVAVTEGGTSELVLVAPTRVLLSGRVREGGEKLAGATVALSARQRGDRPRMPMMFGGGPTAKTDGAGRYEMQDVKAGEYTLSVSHPTRQMPAEYDVVIGELDATFDVELSLATVEGRVTSSEGKPMSNVRVSIARDSGDSGGGPQVMRVMAFQTDGGDSMVVGGEDGGAKSVFTDEQGRYSLRGVVTDADLVVRAEAKDCQPARSEPFEVADNQVKRGVDLVLARAGKIEVSVFKADGTPASMVVVTARAQGEQLRGQEPKSAFIQENGKTTLDGLAPGKWSVSVRAVGLGNPRSGGGRPAGPEAQEIDVVADETQDARFDLP